MATVDHCDGHRRLSNQFRIASTILDTSDSVSIVYYKST